MLEPAWVRNMLRLYLKLVHVILLLVHLVHLIHLHLLLILLIHLHLLLLKLLLIVESLLGSHESFHQPSILLVLDDHSLLRLLLFFVVHKLVAVVDLVGEDLLVHLATSVKLLVLLEDLRA